MESPSKNRDIEKEKDEQIELMTDYAAKVTCELWAQFKPIMADNKLTPNNRMGACLLSVVSLIEMMAKFMAKSGQTPVTYDDMIDHLNHIHSIFDIEVEKEDGK